MLNSYSGAAVLADFLYVNILLQLQFYSLRVI